MNRVDNRSESVLYDEFGSLNCFLICRLRDIGFKVWHRNVVNGGAFGNMFGVGVYGNPSYMSDIDMKFLVVGDTIFGWFDYNIYEATAYGKSSVPRVHKIIVNVDDPECDVMDVVWWFFVMDLWIKNGKSDRSYLS